MAGSDKFMDDIKSAMRKVGTTAFLRTEMLSNKHDWKNSCFLEKKEDLLSHVTNIVETSFIANIAGLPFDYSFWVIREMLETEPIFHAFAGKMPITKEFRFFINNGDIQCYHPYWPEEAFELMGRKLTDDEHKKLNEIQKLDKEEEKEFRHFLKGKEPQVILKEKLLPHPNYKSADKFLKEYKNALEEIIKFGGKNIYFDVESYEEYGDPNSRLVFSYGIMETKEEFRNRERKLFYAEKKKEEDELKKLEFSQEFIKLVTQKVKEVFEGQREKIEEERRVILNQKQALEIKRTRLEDRLLDDTIDRDIFKRKHSELQAQMNALETKISDIEKKRQVDVGLIEEILSLTRNIYQTYQEAPPFLKRHYLRFFFEKFMVRNKKIGKVVYSPIFAALQKEHKIIIRANWLPG
ncbi:hypothetical protein IID23_01610 [Patescibacteria group bacterium]|nr:hypothetical protein [Patescibacteria group bacterium]